MYQKKDAVMTKGFAICSMLVLHLFCRRGSEVFGTPLIWINERTPLIYYLGFFAEICVPLYSMCSGYAMQLMAENKKLSWKTNLHRIGKLMRNYWIVLGMFCCLGIIFIRGGIPGTLAKFLKSVVLLHSYNGAWWYLNTYIILLLLPSAIILFPVKKLNCLQGFFFCFAVNIGCYIWGRFGQFSDIPGKTEALSFLVKEVRNMMNVLPYFWIGAFFCKGKAVDAVCVKLKKRFPEKLWNIGLLGLWFLFFLVNSILEKAVLVTLTAAASFLIFNLLKKAEPVKKTFLFLGKHSTNIWLTHMFFYSTAPFEGLAQKARYPILILVFLLGLCIGTSYVVMGIDMALNKVAYFGKSKKL